MHNGLTRVRTKTAGNEWRSEKMAKSVGNIRELTELLGSYTGETIRAFVLSTQYRRPLEFSDEQLDNTARSLGTFYRLFERIARTTGQDVYEPGQPVERMYEQARTDDDKAFVTQALQHRLRFYEAMDDDFNTAGAIAALHALAGAINRYMDGADLDAGGSDAAGALAAAAGVSLVAAGRVLGLFENPPPKADTSDLDTAAIDRLVEQRNEARRAKDFAGADEIRDRLAQMGISLEDTPEGTIWRKA